jgi:O-antigen ligase
MTWWRTPRTFLAPGLMLFLIAIGGRYTLDRAGFTTLGWVDLRVVGLLVALIVLVVDIARRPRLRIGGRHEGWLIAVLLFFLYQLGSGLWSPPGARIGEKTLDIILMAAFTIAFYLYALGDPERVVRTTFLLFYIGAIVFALGALIGGPGEQGRYSAFGGGPNVFVRIQILGVISAIALFAFHRKLLVFAAVPLFLLAAVLSGSRAGLLAGAAIGGAALLRLRKRLRSGPVAATLVGLTVAGAAIWTFAPPAFVSLIQDRFVEQTVKEHYTSDRTGIWQGAWHLAVDHPLIGTGLDGFYGLIGINQGIEYPHNYVLGVAAEGGAVGILLLLISVVLWNRTVRSGPGDPRLSGFGVAAAASAAAEIPGTKPAPAAAPVAERLEVAP